MDANQFDGRLRELESMTGSEAAMELFNQAYESLLDEVRALPGARYEKLERMQRLLFKQFIYLFGEWRREKAIDAIKGQGEEAITEGMN